MQALKEAGLIPGGDMTPEAALTKLSYLLGRSDLSIEEKRAVQTCSIEHYPCMAASYKLHGPVHACL